MKVTTVTLLARTHYAHPENGRTLCGMVGGVEADSAVECLRCLQIRNRVDTSRGRT